MIHPLDKKMRAIEANVELVKEIEKTIDDAVERIEAAVQLRSKKILITSDHGTAR